MNRLRVPYRISYPCRQAVAACVHKAQSIHQWSALRAVPGRTRAICYPAVRDAVELADMYYKAVQALPPGTVDMLTIPVQGVASRVPERPDYLEPRDDVVREDIRIVEADPSLWHALREADLVLVHDWRTVQHRRVLGVSPKLLNIDRHRSPGDGWTWGEFAWNRLSASARAATQEESQHRFRAFIDDLPRFKRSYIFGTGPSLESAWDYDFSDGYRIVCNTIVNNPDLLKHIDPQLAHEQMRLPG